MYESKEKKKFLEPTGLSNTASYWSVVQEIACKLIEMTVEFFSIEKQTCQLDVWFNF